MSTLRCFERENDFSYYLCYVFLCGIIIIISSDKIGNLAETQSFFSLSTTHVFLSFCVRFPPLVPLSECVHSLHLLTLSIILMKNNNQGKHQTLMQNSITSAEVLLSMSGVKTVDSHLWTYGSEGEKCWKGTWTLQKLSEEHQPTVTVHEQRTWKKSVVLQQILISLVHLICLQSASYEEILGEWAQ